MKRLNYANVMSSIAVFLVLGGATAIAASQLGKNSVGSKQIQKNAVTASEIKKNAVTAAKIKKNAVVGAKLKDGAVGNAKLAAGAVSVDKILDGAVTGAKINAGSTPFTQVVYRARGNASIPFTAGQVYPIANPNYTQPAGQVDQYIGSMEVLFGGTCAPPRSAVAYLLIDAANPLSPGPGELVGFGTVEDKNAGTVVRQMGFAPLGAGTGSAMRGAPASPIPHTFSILMLGTSCSSGSGVNALSGSVDVLGTK